MRRIKSVSLSIPCVTGPYTSISCTLNLTQSKVRQSSIVTGDYDDEVNYTTNFIGSQSIATSSGQNDSGLFELNFRDERYLPFEYAGVISEWALELHKEYRQFDYDSITDVILHMRYTARPGGEKLKQAAEEHLSGLLAEIGTSELMQLFNLQHDFPTEWHQFVTGNGDFGVTLRKEHFPYLVQNQTIYITGQEYYLIEDDQPPVAQSNGLTVTEQTNTNDFELTLSVSDRSLPIFVIVRYAISST